MAVRVNPKWFEITTENFIKMKDGGFYETNVTYGPAIKKICLFLVENNIPFKVINMGGGVKKITNQVDTCSKCGGTGKC